MFICDNIIRSLEYIKPDVPGQTTKNSDKQQSHQDPTRWIPEFGPSLVILTGCQAVRSCGVMWSIWGLAVFGCLPGVVICREVSV
jgi:hypothetical protein